MRLIEGWRGDDPAKVFAAAGTGEKDDFVYVTALIEGDERFVTFCVAPKDAFALSNQLRMAAHAAGLPPINNHEEA